MKLLSIAVPCYNSQDYMRNCVDSLLKGGELVEILIVNDGSKDDTAKIADEYAEKYPTIVRVIHQENGGHGEAVNTGIRNATGFYFKVVDSDDWVNEEAFEAILKKLQELIAGPHNLTVHDRVGACFHLTQIFIGTLVNPSNHFQVVVQDFIEVTVFGSGFCQNHRQV